MFMREASLFREEMTKRWTKRYTRDKNEKLDNHLYGFIKSLQRFFFSRDFALVRFDNEQRKMQLNFQR